MDVERLIGELSEHRKLMWTVDMKPGVPRCHAVPLDLIVEAAAALAKLQAERDEAIDAQFTVDENCVSIGWEEVAAMWRSRATHAEARAEKAEAERDHNWKEYLDERSARMAENNRNHRLTEALQPFAVWADKMPDVVPELSADIMNVLRFAVANGHLTGAHFRAASRALGGGE